jgi:hypothetical protein
MCTLLRFYHLEMSFGLHLSLSALTHVTLAGGVSEERANSSKKRRRLAIMRMSECRALIMPLRLRRQRVSN